MIDQRKTWAVQASDRKTRADFSSTALEVIMEEGVPRNTVEIAYSVKGFNGTIGVIPKAGAPIGKIATLRLYRRDYLPTDENYYIDGGTVSLYVTEPEKLKAATPTVKLKAADDLKLTLELGGFDTGTTYVPSCREGGQYFRIVVTPKADDNGQIPDTIRSATEKAYFIKREFPEVDEDEYDESDDGEEAPEPEPFVQTARLVVNNAKIGQKWQYDVNVSLVQTYDHTQQKRLP